MVGRHLRPFGASATELRGEQVLLEKRDGVAIITLNAPERLNAQDAAMGDEFTATVEHLCGAGADGVGAVIVTGAGRAFSAGGDLQFLKERSVDDPVRTPTRMILY